MTNLINYLSDIITDFFIENKIIADNERAIYKYGTEVTISTLIGILIILSVGFAIRNILDSVIFLLCFITVRVYSGGYHADTYVRCNLIFVSVFISTILLKHIIPNQFGFEINIILLICAFIIIVVFSPIENKHKPFNKIETRRYRKISIIMSLGWIAVVITLLFFGINILDSVAITMVSIAILMIAGKIKNKIIKLKGVQSL